jgi:hypothetical protein
MYVGKLSFGLHLLYENVLLVIVNFAKIIHFLIQITTSRSFKKSKKNLVSSKLTLTLFEWLHALFSLDPTYN